METVLISGGTGLVGKKLSELLTKKGYEVILLSTNKGKSKNYKTFYWDWENGRIEPDAIVATDYIIHLAGAGIFDKRWTPSRKKLIENSRIVSGKLIFNTLKKEQKKIKGFISASAIGYYGTITSQNIFSEASAPANDFLGNLCRKWEVMADEFNEFGIRTVKIRTGVVISKNASIIKSLTKAVNLGFGAAFGSGQQYMPWIHVDDLCAIYIKAIEDVSMSGAYNAVAPSHISNQEFTNEMAKFLNKTIWLPNVPAFVLKLIFGERAQMLLKGSRVSSKKLIDTGYSFLYPELKMAISNSINQP